MPAAVRTAVFAVFAAAAAAGCGGGAAPASNIAVQPVRGKVMLGAAPLPGGLLKLTLVTAEKTGNAEATASVGPDGTFEPRMVGDKAGLVAGRWKVVIEPVYVRDGKSAKAAVPARYTTDASDLTFDVPAGGDTNITLTLRP